MRTTYYLAAALAAATSPMAASFGQTGNGAPSGTHYNLNIIGVSHNKSPNMNQASGNVIFAALGTDNAYVTTKILLSPGEFHVLDKNGTDGVASFQLPGPDLSGSFTYTVWARALGKPGGHSTIKTCADTLGSGLTGIDAGTICSTENEVFLRTKGKQSFRNVTTALTTITFDLDVALFPTLATCLGLTQTTGTVTVRVSLFNPCLENFLWQYDNSGLKLLQLRFYEN